jgi:hypothetical protein
VPLFLGKILADAPENLFTDLYFAWIYSFLSKQQDVLNQLGDLCHELLAGFGQKDAFLSCVFLPGCAPNEPKGFDPCDQTCHRRLISIELFSECTLSLAIFIPDVDEGRKLLSLDRVAFSGKLPTYLLADSA